MRGLLILAALPSGILSGNGPGFLAGGPHSQFVMAIKIEAFVDTTQFKTDLDKLLERISSMQPADGQDRVYYAGLIEHEEVEVARLFDFQTESFAESLTHFPDLHEYNTGPMEYLHHLEMAPGYLRL